MRWFSWGAFIGEPSPELGERFRSGGKTSWPQGLGKQGGKAQKLGLGLSAEGRRNPGLTLGGTLRAWGWGGGCGRAGVAAALCLPAPVDRRGNRRRRPHRGSASEEGKAEGEAGTQRGGVRWRVDPDAPEATNAGPGDLVGLLDASSREASSTTPVLAPHPLNSFIVPTS